MDNLNREGHDSEIERLRDKMSNLDPASDEYAKIARNYDILVKTATEDDRVKAETELERFRIDADADKINSEEKWHKWTAMATIAGAVVTVAGSIASCMIVCHHNTAQVKQILFFEENGYTITSQSTKNLIKMPVKI